MIENLYNSKVYRVSSNVFEVNLDDKKIKLYPNSNFKHYLFLIMLENLKLNKPNDVRPYNYHTERPKETVKKSLF